MMKVLEFFPSAAEVPWELLYFVALAALSFWYFTNSFDLPPQPYNVDAPDAIRDNWKGEILREPSIKISGVNAIQCYDPSTGAQLGQVNAVSRSAIDRAIESATEAREQWSQTSFAQRRQVLRTILRFVLDHQDEIIKVCSRDSGKCMLDAALGEILVTTEKLQWTIKHGEKALRPEARPTNFLLAYKANQVVYEPLDRPAVAIVSWNYPFHNFISPVIAALFAGNAIIVKPSERTAWSANYFLEIVRSALVACGHSSRLVHTLCMWPSEAEYLTSHPGISHITFIGSSPIAKHVLRSAATSITPTCVELGGKDAAVVLKCAPSLETTADILLRGSFQSAGQNCVGIERIIAHSSVYESLISYFLPRIRALRVGSDLEESSSIDVGAMIMNDNFDRLEALIADAVKQGARLLHGGTRFRHPEYPSGHYFTPTLLVDVTRHMRIAQEECFAPICLMMKFDRVEEAISLANSCQGYALGASVFGTTQSDVDACVSGIKVGMVSVNDFAVYYAVQLPFGGRGGSGYGRFAGEEGLRSLSNLKSVCKDRFGFLGIRTAIPKASCYPVDNAGRGSGKASQLASGIVKLGYGSWREFPGALMKVIRGSM